MGREPKPISPGLGVRTKKPGLKNQSQTGPKRQAPEKKSWPVSQTIQAQNRGRRTLPSYGKWEAGAREMRTQSHGQRKSRGRRVKAKNSKTASQKRQAKAKRPGPERQDQRVRTS